LWTIISTTNEYPPEDIEKLKKGKEKFLLKFYWKSRSTLSMPKIMKQLGGFNVLLYGYGLPLMWQIFCP